MRFLDSVFQAAGEENFRQHNSCSFHETDRIAATFISMCVVSTAVTKYICAAPPSICLTEYANLIGVYHSSSDQNNWKCFHENSFTAAQTVRSSSCDKAGLMGRLRTSSWIRSVIGKHRSDQVRYARCLCGAIG